MSAALDKLSISGFKSIRDLKNFELKNLNILIGANGSGKSNFVEIFRLLREMVRSNLGGYVLERGEADNFLHNGPKVTSSIEMSFEFGLNSYRFSLVPTIDGKLLVKREEQKYEKGSWKIIGFDSLESQLPVVKDEAGWLTRRGVGHYVYKAIINWVVYHFHDTSLTAGMRRSAIMDDYAALRADASNIAPFLFALREDWQESYQDIRNALRLCIPFFDDFLLRPSTAGQEEKVKLTWTQKGSDFPMQPYHLSDGSIRFICLATALLQPNPPSTIIIDEPELGLHPAAISLLAEMIKDAAKRTQIIVATQSPALIDNFAVEDIIVVKRHEGASDFQRLEEKDFSTWLEEYTLGELWTKNVIQGGVSYE